MVFDERLGHESGEWFERYLEVIFRSAGFQTERDRLFFKDVKHEIDVWASSEFANIAVECKDWRYFPDANIKKEFDAFIAKVRDIGASAGVFAVNITDRGQLKRYAEYLKRYGIVLWDKVEVEKWQDAISRYKSREEYQKRLCDALGIQIRPRTGAEKTFGLLKKVGGLSVKTATAGLKAIDSMTEPKKRRRRKNSRSR